MSEECGERVFIPVLKKKKIERDYDLLFSILFICLFVFILFYFWCKADGYGLLIDS